MGPQWFLLTVECFHSICKHFLSADVTVISFWRQVIAWQMASTSAFYMTYSKLFSQTLTYCNLLRVSLVSRWFYSCNRKSLNLLLKEKLDWMFSEEPSGKNIVSRIFEHFIAYSIFLSAHLELYALTKCCWQLNIECNRQVVQLRSSCSFLSLYSVTFMFKQIGSKWRLSRLNLTALPCFWAVYWSSCGILEHPTRLPLLVRAFTSGNELPPHLSSVIRAGSLAALCTVLVEIIETLRRAHITRNLF